MQKQACKESLYRQQRDMSFNATLLITLLLFKACGTEYEGYFISVWTID